MPILQAKKENAIDAVSQLIALLERCREYGWASKFIPIKDALVDLDFDKAIHLYSRIPMPNMGGFLDLILSERNGHLVRSYDEDNALLEMLRGVVSQAIGNLRLYLSYEIDRPLVKVPRGG
ncbi:hypothetical protein [Geomonas propionica]|uniref:Uncharacterized protein n=1 Tax=Geomonas propionica TaxID=2798582 RepID=A0ABS0YXJ9_9BACT|nr:hypothetical protein [Geomonas propionica]MBJ6802675.1 hypothetical protein [Geomonas propionica]